MIVKLGENWPVPVASGGDRAFNVKEQNFGGGENQEKQERGKGGEGGEKQKRGGKEEQEGENRRKDNHGESLVWIAQLNWFVFLIFICQHPNIKDIAG